MTEERGDSLAPCSGSPASAGGSEEGTLQGQKATPMQTTQQPVVVTMVIDCHAYAYHLTDPNYPECGPDNLTRMAETYGILIRHLPDHEWEGWAWMYEISGPVSHLVGFLASEYCGGVAEAEEMVSGYFSD